MFLYIIKRKQEVLNEIIEAKAQMDCNIGHYKDLLNKLQVFFKKTIIFVSL